MAVAMAPPRSRKVESAPIATPLYQRAKSQLRLRESVIEVRRLTYMSA
jgi:hypothetical protein